MDDITKTQAIEWFTKTSKLVKLTQHRDVKQTIINQTKFLHINTSMPQRLWHIINETSQIPECKICNSLVSWDRRYKKYKTYCGNPQCPNIDKDILIKKKKNTDYKSIADKRKLTNLKRYGHTNYLASVDGRHDIEIAFDAQSKETKQLRYKKVATARTTTMQQKYNVDNFSHTKLSSNALSKLSNKDWLIEQHHGNRKSLSQIGEELDLHSSCIISNRLKNYGLTTLDVRLSEDTIKKLNDKKYLETKHVQEKKSLTDIAYELNIKGGATVVSRYFKKHGITVLNPTPRSLEEKQIGEFLKSINIGFKSNDRTIIQPLELDIFIPTYHIAIEYCGLYWHSESNGKDKHYHKNKHDLCKAKGIQLITIFEDEWLQRNNQVKLKIQSMLNIDPRNVVYARNTIIKKISTREKKQFIDQNHIQGDGPCSLSYGAFYKDEIVAVMGFLNQKNNTFILNRYATSHRVVGGFSKLLKHFQQNNDWNEIISFADQRWSDGNLYKKTGWLLDKSIRPDYYYSTNGHNRFHKFNFRRKNLPKILKHFDSALSERENCDNNGVLRIWDCGKLRFTLHNYSNSVVSIPSNVHHNS